ncbi:hypothetical protein LUZ60_003461 [Juncus effusus]|nr:hypothetical protein LUZ60_003461 [Juncus effusus]
MARKKVTLAYIANDSTRRATFKKRKKGLIKKASELSTLCDVKSCVVIYGPQDPEPEVWPSPMEGVRVLSLFKSMPEMEQCKKMVDQEGFLRQRASKLQEHLHKMDRENREYEMNLLMHEGLSSRDGLEPVKTLEDTATLALMVEIRLKLVQDSIDQIKTPLTSRSEGLVDQEGNNGEGSLSMETSGVNGWYNSNNINGHGYTEEMMMIVQGYNDGPNAGGEYFPLN